MLRTRVGQMVLVLAAAFLLVLVGTGASLAVDVAFKDAPAQDHWAGPAVGELGIGKILIGYPDGTFRGDRAATRYELATALDRLYALIRQLLAKETVGPAELGRVSGELQGVREELAGVAGRLEDLSDLRRDVARLAERVTAEELEARVAAEHEAAQQADQETLRKAAAGLADAVTDLQKRHAEVAEKLEARLAGHEDMVGRQAAILTQLQADLEALRTGNAPLAAELAELQQKFTALAVRVERLEAPAPASALAPAQDAATVMAPVEPVRAAVDGESTLVALRKENEELATWVATLGRQIAELVSRLEAQPAEVAGLEQPVGGVPPEEQQARLEEHGLALAQHDAVLVAQQADLEELRKVDASLATGALELQQKLAELTDEVRAQAELGPRLDDQSARLVQSETNLGMLRKSLAQTVNQVAQLAAELADHVKADDLLSGRLTELQKGLEGLATQLREVRQSGEALGGRVTAVEDRSDELGKGFEKLTGRVQENQQGLSDLRLRVQALEEETAKLKEGQRRMAWMFAIAAAALAVF